MKGLSTEHICIANGHIQECGEGQGGGQGLGGQRGKSRGHLQECLQ